MKVTIFDLRDVDELAAALAYQWNSAIVECERVEYEGGPDAAIAMAIARAKRNGLRRAYKDAAKRADRIRALFQAQELAACIGDPFDGYSD